MFSPPILGSYDRDVDVYTILKTRYMRLPDWQRKLVESSLPLLIFYIIYISYVLPRSAFDAHLSGKWQIIPTAVFASFIAGATAEGGGAVTFPVMTLILDVNPTVARDFSFMLQSVGMTSAAYSICFTQQLRLERNMLILGTIGGAVGLLFGLHQVAPRLQPPQAKIFFVSMWLSFAVALFLINYVSGRDRIVHVTTQNIDTRKAGAMLIFGFLGGIVSSISGSGLDVTLFSMFVLLFRVSEKVVTPTSVVCMAINTVLGVWIRVFIQQADISEAFHYFILASPVVAVFAPLGAWVSSRSHRLVFAYFVCFLDVIQYITALVIILPDQETSKERYNLVVLSIVTFLISIFVFGLCVYIGGRLLLQSSSSFLISESNSRLTYPLHRTNQGEDHSQQQKQQQQPQQQQPQQ